MAAINPLLELNTTSVNMPFEIHTMEWIEQNRGQQNAVAHRHNYFVIIWVKKASGIHWIDLKKYPLHDNTIYCITPGQVHLLKTEGVAAGYVISFTADFLGMAGEHYDLLFNTGLFYTFSNSPVIAVNEEHEMEDVVQKMIKEFSNFFLLRAEILRGFLKIFLIYLTRQFEKPEPASKSADLVKQFLALVEKNYTIKKMVTDYAEELVVTPNHLNEVVKKVTGFPASHHIQQRIVLEAKRQGAYSNVTMKEIAYALGFDDTAHFSKFFKNASGQSFTDFKKEMSIIE
jgi:AraC family transcriptional regulator, transcriptional activator of pobA